MMFIPRFRASHVLALAGSLAALAASPPMLRAQPLPKAADVIARYIEAIGGAKAFESITSVRQKATMEMPSMGLTAEAENIAAAPDRMAQKASIPGIGDIVSGTNGELAWQVNPMQGPRLLTGKELQDAMDAADFYGNLLFPPDRYSSMETVGIADFAGEQAYELRLVRKASDKIVTRYFSVATGLMIGSSSTQESPMGSTPTVSVFSDYRDFGGRKFATRSEATVGPSKIVMTVRDITLNDVPDSAFAAPEAVKALVRK